MRRYERDYDDLASTMRFQRQGRGGGLDPNYRGGVYRGLRTDANDEEQAAYGRYRVRHADDLGGFGGFDGRYDERGTRFLGGPAGHAGGSYYGAEAERRPGGNRYDRAYRGYDRGYRVSGGVRGGYDAPYRSEPRPRGRFGER